MNISTLTPVNIFLLVLQWLLGFYLQVVPVAVICVYPFKNQFRCSNKLFYSILTATIVITSIIWLVAVSIEYLSHGGTNSNYLAISDAFFISSLVVLLVVFLWGIKSKLSYKLFVFLMGMSYGFALEITNRTINNFTNTGNVKPFLYSIPDIVHYLILNAVLIGPMIYLMEIIKESFSANKNSKLWRTLTIILSGILLFLLFFYEVPYAISANPLDTLYIFINALFFFIFILYYWIFTVIREEQITLRNQVKWELLAKSYKLEEQNLEEIRKVRHELRHHFLALQLYLKNNDYEGLENYLDQITDLETDLPVKSFSSDNLFNLILSNYEQTFLKNDIPVEFNIEVPNKIGLEDGDLIELFTNLLDNAIEATKKLKKDKFVKLTVKQNGNFLSIKCENSYKKGQLKRSGKRFITNKTNTFLEKHGIGINIMREITKKYNGYIDFTTDDNLFTVLINLSQASE